MKSSSQSKPFKHQVLSSLVIQFKVHPVMYFIVTNGDVILEDGVPLLEHNLVPSGARLRSNQLLEVANGVIWIAFDSNFFAESIIACHLVEDTKRVRSDNVNRI